MSRIGKWDPNATSGKFAKKNRFYLNEGSNIYRLLPPVGDLADTNRLYGYWSVYWLTGDDNKKRPVPTLLQKSKDGTIIQRCPIYDALQAKEKQLEALKKDPVKNANAIEALTAFLKAHSLDKGYYYNVMKPSGEIGVLKIKYKAQQALKALFDQLKTEGIDPINAGEENGIYIDFKTARDERNQFVYTVVKHQKTYRDPATKDLISRTERAPLDEAALERVEKEAEDLTKLFKYMSPEQMADLAKFDAKIISRVFAQANPSNRTPSVVEEFSQEDEEPADPAGEAVVEKVMQESVTKTAGAPTAAAVAASQKAKVYDSTVVHSFLTGGDEA